MPGFLSRAFRVFKVMVFSTKKAVKKTFLEKKSQEVEI